MSPLNDKDLDRVSREAADQYDVGQSTSGWDALESRLNKEMPQDDRDRKRLLFFLLFMILLTGGGLTMILKNDWSSSNSNEIAEKSSTIENHVPSSTEKNGQQPVIADPSSDQASSSATKAPNSSVKKLNDIEKPSSPKSENTSIDTKKPVTAGSNDRINNIQQQQNSYLQPKISKRPQSIRPKENLPVISNRKIPAESNPDLINNPFDLTSTNQSNQTGKELKPSLPASLEMEKVSFAAINKHIPVKPVGAEVKEEIVPKGKKTNSDLARKTNRGFELGVLAGGDLSNVKFSSAGRAGVNLGLTIGYRFSNRWSVNTGVIYTKKNYTALEKDFTKKGTIVNYKIEDIEGNCSMLDIPLNVRYDFGMKNKRSYFASAGLSTYLMDREYYEYYIYYGSTRRWRDWETKDNSNYLFSIVNLSAGMERQIGKRFSLQAEPYLKLPLKGLGQGELRLNSYGINLSLKYKLPTQR